LLKKLGFTTRPLAQRKQDAEAAGEVFNQKPIKPIVGCEFFVCEDHSNKSQKDNGYQMVFLAKNKKGYQNLVKMSFLGRLPMAFIMCRVSTVKLSNNTKMI
jgi:DNA polymerase-3 subunit alpha